MICAVRTLKEGFGVIYESAKAHEPQMFNETDAIAYELISLNDDSTNLANVCKYCGCLYPAE